MKKEYVMPQQLCIDLALKTGVAQGTGALVGSGKDQGVDDDALVRGERNFDEDSFASGSTTNVWEKPW